MRSSFLFKETMKPLFIIVVIFLMASMNLLAQGSFPVSGLATSSGGEPLPGATIIIKGTTKAVVTNLEGLFNASVEKGQVLDFSYIGYLKNEVKIRDQKEVNVSFDADVTSLSQVVVVGYGNMRKVDITGLVATIDNSSFETQKLSTVEQALQGKVAGLRIVNDGAPGADIELEIRGISSINPSGEPLVIIDGYLAAAIKTST